MKAAFDDAAKNYDSDFTSSQIGIAQREIIYSYLNKITGENKKLSILEINCGTGEDACYLASKGHNVFATDISEQMISVAKSKADEKGITSGLQFAVCSFENLTSIAGIENFDLIFSNFGGLNCIDADDLKYAFDSFHKFLKPDGKLFLVIMGRFCLWECLYYFSKLQFSKAFRRFAKKGIAVGLTNATQHTFYYSSDELVKMCDGKFVQVNLKPVGLFIPPSYLEPFVKKHLNFFSLMEWLDAKLEHSFFSKMSDHYFIELKKVN